MFDFRQRLVEDGLRAHHVHVERQRGMVLAGRDVMDGSKMQYGLGAVALTHLLETGPIADVTLDRDDSLALLGKREADARLSTTTSTQPIAESRSTMRDPMNPAPPVTRIRSNAGGEVCGTRSNAAHDTWNDHPRNGAQAFSL